MFLQSFKTAFAPHNDKAGATLREFRGHFYRFLMTAVMRAQLRKFQ